MTNVIPFEPRKTLAAARHPALERLDGIRTIVARLDVTKLHTQQDVTQVLCFLALAQKCARVVVNGFRDAPNSRILFLIGQRLSWR